MSFMRHRIIFILVFMLLSIVLGDQTTKQLMTNERETAQSAWQPVGRGDPLKDPTYDYMPPVLDRVRYWGEGSSNRNKNDILLLGVPSKKLSSIKQKDKFSYGPIKRTYYSPPYQHYYSSPLHHQQQQQPQYLPQRLMPPPKHVADSHSTSTHHYQQQQQQQPHFGWQTPTNVYTEPRPENSINQMKLLRPNVTPSSTRLPSNAPFLPTLSPSDRSPEPSSTSPTISMHTQTTVKHDGPKVYGHMMSNSHVQTAKPLLHSILQTETASPFTKKPSSAYQIEYTSNIYNPEDINSMLTSSSYTTTFTPTKPTIRPMSMSKTTTKTSPVPLSSTSAAANIVREEQKHYVQPEVHAGWPVYNLIIEGHSKVKTYGLKNDDGGVESNLPKIRPIQAKENPIVEHVTNSDEGPEFNRLQTNKKDQKQLPMKVDDEKKTAMASLWSLFDSSFGNFLSDESVDKAKLESENKYAKNGKENSHKHKTRRSATDHEDNKKEQVFSVSFQVEDTNAPETYQKGTVISEKLWPFQTADESSQV